MKVNTGGNIFIANLQSFLREYFRKHILSFLLISNAQKYFKKVAALSWLIISFHTLNFELIWCSELLISLLDRILAQFLRIFLGYDKLCLQAVGGPLPVNYVKEKV